MPMLTGLPGTTAPHEAVSVSSRSSAIAQLRLGSTITASGDNGALNVWRDDGGSWRCQFMVHMAVQSDLRTRHLAAVDRWLRTWFTALGR